MLPLWPSTAAAAAQHCYCGNMLCDLGGEGRGIGIVVDHLVVLQGVAVHVVPTHRPVEVAGLVANQTGLCKKGAGLSHGVKPKME